MSFLKSSFFTRARENSVILAVNLFVFYCFVLLGTTVEGPWCQSCAEEFSCFGWFKPETGHNGVARSQVNVTRNTEHSGSRDLRAFYL